MIRHLLFIFFSFFFATLFANNFTIQHFSSDNNEIPQNSIKSIVQDKYGYTWLSTENGLVRFDGFNFKVFNSNNVENVISNRMYMFYGSVEKDSIYIVNDSNQEILIHNRTVRYHDEKDLYINLNFLKLPYFHYLENLQVGFYIPNDEQYFKISLTNEKNYILGNDSIYHLNKDSVISKRPYKIKNKSTFILINEKLIHFESSKKYTLITDKEINTYKLPFTFDNNFKVVSSNASKQTFLISNDTLYNVSLDSN